MPRWYHWCQADVYRTDQAQPRFDYLVYLHLFQPHTIMNNPYSSKSIANK
jgi:hypothetical protein